MDLLSGPGIGMLGEVSIVFHAPGGLASPMGDGNGVISANGPRPGDDTAEAGDKEPPVKFAAARADLTLEVLTGSPVLGGVYRG